MLKDFEKFLNNYIEIILKKGLNLQSGQKLLITPLFSSGVPIELAKFVRLIVKKAYQYGARFVDVLWRDDEVMLSRFKYAPRDSFEEFAKWRNDTALKFIKNGDAILAIYVEDPYIFEGVEPSLIAVHQQTIFKNLKPVLDEVSKNTSNWLVISAPIINWAHKLFPNESQKIGNEKLWDLLFEICRVKNDNPMKIWEDHIKNLQLQCKNLNKKRYSSLKLTAPRTDLTIGLPKGHLWMSGSEKSKNGITFIANIPTEEIFTIPHKDQVNGYVTSSKPLFFGGGLIEDFTLTFTDGTVTKAIAKKGEEFLKAILGTDEGAKQIGEIALVPQSSPVAQTDKLFYNILIDENAASHIALGNGYRGNLENGDSMTDQEFSKAGGNISATHLDFMVGSNQMNIDGILANGTREPIMRNGEWVNNLLINLMLSRFYLF